MFDPNNLPHPASDTVRYTPDLAAFHQHLLEGDPNHDRYLARLAMAPVVYDGFYEDLSVALQEAKDSDLPTGRRWAWLHMPLWLHHRTEAQEATSGPFTILDMCSSLRIFAEINTAKNLTRCKRWGGNSRKSGIRNGY